MEYQKPIRISNRRRLSAVARGGTEAAREHKLAQGPFRLPDGAFCCESQFARRPASRKAFRSMGQDSTPENRLDVD
jgi:hypothetical protein